MSDNSIEIPPLSALASNILRDPFSHKNVVSVNIYVTQHICRATINFNEENTFGSQIIDGNNLMDIYTKLESFFEEIKQKGKP